MLAPEELQKKPGYIEVSVTVTDSNGHEDSGLTKDDFKVTLDGRPSDVAFFSADKRAPEHFGVLIDTSGSTTEKLSEMNQLAFQLINTLPPDSSVFLIAFNARAYLLQSSTHDRSKVTNKLKFLRPSGETAMYDAIVMGCNELSRAAGSKRLVLITDGIDNASRKTEDDAISALKNINAKLDIIGIGDPGSLKHRPGDPMGSFFVGPASNTMDFVALKRLTSPTGGNLVVIPGDAEEQVLESTIEQLQPGANPQYALGFIAPERTDASAAPWGELSVVITKPEGATVHAPNFVALAVPPSAATNERIDLNGKFTGKIVNLNGIDPQLLEIVGKLTQTDNSVSGDWETSAGTFGTMLGTIAGNRISLRIDREQSCKGFFQGIGTITEEGKRVRGSLKGRDCTPVTDFVFDVSR